MITMNAAIADKKVQRSLLIWKPLSNDRSDHMETERPWISKVQISKHFLSIFNFIQVIELNNEYETTEIKLKPRKKFVA